MVNNLVSVLEVVGLIVVVGLVVVMIQMIHGEYLDDQKPGQCPGSSRRT